MESNRILIVDDESVVRNALSVALGRAGFEVDVASDAKEALEVFKRERPYLVLTDLTMPGMDGYSLMRRIKSMSPRTIVVVITGYGSDHDLSRVLAAGGNNFLRKPLDVPSLLAMASGYRDLAAEESRLQRARNGFESMEFRLDLASDPEDVVGAAQIIVHELAPFLPEQDQLEVRLGVFEMLQNALEHGNLEITREAKSAALELGQFRNLIDERRADLRLGGRRIRVRVKADTLSCRVTILDEGTGFDWRPWTDGSGDSRSLEASGRGIQMTRFYFDEIVFNETGNGVTLVKSLVRKTPAPQT